MDLKLQNPDDLPMMAIGYENQFPQEHHGDHFMDSNQLDIISRHLLRWTHLWRPTNPPRPCRRRRICLSLNALFLILLTPVVVNGQSINVTPLQPMKPDPGLTFIMGLNWAMEGPDSPNFNKAIQALQGAAENNSRAAQSILGRMLVHTQDPTKFRTGIAWLRRASSGGDVEASWLLSSVYRNGGPGLDPDRDACIQYLEKAADQKHPDAAYALARLLDTPSSSSSELVDCIKWYRLAAESGDVNAQMRLGYLFHSGLHVRKDLNEAIKYYSMAAENGHRDATYNLAQVYDFAPDNLRDVRKAAALYKSSADAGHSDSQLYFAQKILQGQADDNSFETAVTYLKRAADSGSARALFQYGVIRLEFAESSQDATSAINALEQASNANIKPALVELARLYYFGRVPWVKADPTKAATIYKSLARDGDKDAQALLGFIFQTGEGTSVDLPTAAAYYLEAANKGAKEAQYNLGMMYFNGSGIQQSRTEAIRWLSKAAENGHPLAALNLGVAYKKTNDQTRAVEWFRKAAENGLDNAAFYLGIVFDESVRQDSARRESLKWFRQAARSGNIKAQYSLAYRLMEVPTPRENLVEAYQWLLVAEANGHTGAPIGIRQLENQLLPDEIERAAKEATDLTRTMRSTPGPAANP